MKPYLNRAVASAAVVLLALSGASVRAAEPIPSLDVAHYMGTWHQVAHYPNRFQQQCARDTTASYRLLDGGSIEVVNRCTTADGRIESVTGVARPRGATLADGRLQPASLKVSFLPAWLRWLPFGWGSYDLVFLSADESVAVVSEPSKTYLWVLARSRALDEQRWTAVQEFLRQEGFEMRRIVREPVTR